METGYPVLSGLLAERRIARVTVADAIGITTRSLRNKMDGNTQFTWDEACMIQEKFFPDICIKELFARSL